MNSVLVLDGYEPGSKSLATFKKEHPDKVKAMRILDLDWPLAANAYRHLFVYVPKSVVIDGEPLAFRCLARALTAYEGSLGRRDDERFRAFMDSLLAPAVEVFRSVCFKADPDKKWCADEGVPLASFLDECAKPPANRPVAAQRQPPGDDVSIATAMTQFLLGLSHE